MDRSFLLHDTTLGVLRRRLGVLGHDVHAFDKDLILIGKHFEDYTGFFRVLIVSGDHYHAITFFNIELRFESVTHFIILYPPAAENLTLSWFAPSRRTGGPSTYNTSGAREMIFIYPLSRSSLATGPTIPLPPGSSQAFNNPP